MARRPKTVMQGFRKSPGFQKGHVKYGGRKKNSPNKVQILEIPIPLEKLSSVTEALKKFNYDPAIEILKLLGAVPGVPEGWPLQKHQKASIALQLMAMKQRESGAVPDPQTPPVPPGQDKKPMSTDELLKRVLRATHDEQLRSASS